MKRDMDRMIKTLMSKGYKINERTIYAMQQVPRHKFIKEKGAGYLDTPLPIGFGQTISQPFIVAYMTDKLNIKPLDKVLEIGTGSGYQAAILAEMAYDIYSVERIFKLSQKTEKLLRQLGYVNIKLKVGDGYKGWKENAPYDRIIVTAMSNEIPQELIKQLNVGGKMIIPYKGKLELITKTKTSYDQESLTGVAFVPLVKG